MKRNKSKGGALVEFSFCLLVLVPLFLGTIGVGLQLIQSMQTIQLARDSGRMYARKLDFGQPGNLTILATMGSDLGLHTLDTGGTAVLILSAVKYIDKTICLAGCTNFKQWVFVQRVVVGNGSYRTSNLGSPLTSGIGKVTMDAGGNIAAADQTGNSNDVATFSAV